MNGNEQILAELKKISAWADMQRKFTRWSLILAAVVIPILIICGVVLDSKINTQLENSTPGQKLDWYDVDQNVRVGDADKAIKIGETLIVKTPQYPEGHQRLAGAYLAAGKIDKAKEHYAEAFRLYPSEENEKSLIAIEKRIKAGSPQPSR